jgi:hypothetical protein
VLLIASFFALQISRSQQAQAVAIPADKQNILSAPCPGSLPAGQSVATGLIWPSPENVSAASGGTNLYSGVHLCGASAHGSISGAKLTIDTTKVSRTSGSGTLSMNPNYFLITAIPSPQSAGLSAARGGFSQQSAGHRINFSNLSAGYNCWRFELNMQISGWQTLNLGENSFCVYYTPPNNGPIGSASLSCEKEYTNPNNGYKYQITGWTHDPDGPVNSPQKNLTVRMYINGVLRATTYANKGPNNDWFYFNHNYNDNTRRNIRIVAYNPFNGQTKNLLEGQFGPCNRLPEGNFEAAHCTNGLSGWALDRDAVFTSLDIHVYVDGPAGAGTGFAFKPKTGPGPLGAGEYRVIERTDVNAAYPDQNVGNYHGFQIPIESMGFKDAYSHEYYVYFIDTNGGTNRFIGNKRAIPCAPPTCDSFSTTPGNPEVGTSFDATANFNYTPGSRGWALNYDFYIQPEGNPEVGRGNRISDQGNKLWSGATVTIRNSDTMTIPNRTAPDTRGQFGATYRIRWTIPGADRAYYQAQQANSSNPLGFDDPGSGLIYGTLRCSDNYTVSTRPYLKFYGNDVFAGAQFDPDSGVQGLDGEGCTATTGPGDPPGIYTWQRRTNQDDSTGENGAIQAGSSVEYAAFAVGAIGETDVTTKFGTAGLRLDSSTPTSVSSGLVFGNKPSSTEAKSAIGNYAPGGRCVPNYYEKRPVTPVTGNPPSVSFAADDRDDSGSYFYDRSLLVVNTSTIEKGEHITIYASGKVVIMGDIMMEGFNSTDDIPSLHIISNSDIGVFANVREVAGVLIAKDTVHTCSNRAGVGVSNSPSYCDRKLTINGAVITDKIKFQRTPGTLRDSTPNEGPGGNSAEVINFLPELYLAQPQGWEVPGDSSLKYDYIISLPPIL